MKPTFWSGRRVLVTGHTGFKGSWLSLWLQKLGAEVIGFGLPPPTDPSLFESAEVGCGMASIVGDVRDQAAVARAFAIHRPEIVLHLAAQSLVRASYESPIETYATNVMGTAHVLDAVRTTPGVRSVVIVTSDKCYANQEWIWGYRETEPMGGHDPYSSSKGCAELVTSAYSDSYFPAHDYDRHGVAVATARAGNVIGGGDWAKDRLLPDIVRALSIDTPAIIRSPSSVRPWQHVLEPLRGYLQLAERLYEEGPRFAGGWNFGPAEDDAQPVSWIVERVVKLWGDGARWELDGDGHPHEARQLRLDCSKAHSLLGWRPALPLSTALDSIVNWYRGYYRQCANGELSARHLTAREIARYEEALR